MNPDLTGQNIVVTGAGNGIGKALAARLAAAGARVVVNDLDGDTAKAVADEISGIALPGDLATPDGPACLVTEAVETLGRVDLFFANAGIDAGAGAYPDDLVWGRALDVNLMAHVRAARVLIPHWLDIGGGHLVVTASAAGLLTMIGNAPYSVSKHAAVAFAEWLAITYGARGIRVQVVCPQGVDTRMLRESGAVRALLNDGALSPEAVAEHIVTNLRDERFLILPHPEVAGYYAARATDTDRWLAGMRGLNARTATPDPTATMPQPGTTPAGPVYRGGHSNRS